MPDQTVPTDTAELTGYAATAAELRRIADALETLPPGDKPPYVSLSILPEKAVEAVDAVALAVIGQPGGTELIAGEWVHIARQEGFGSPINIRIHAAVPGPPDERDAELERLRAEVASLRSAEDPDHGRTTAVGEAKPDTLMVPHGDPGDGHAYECCGKVGRISKHRPGCPVGGE